MAQHVFRKIQMHGNFCWKKEKKKIVCRNSNTARITSNVEQQELYWADITSP